jgi:hypothetical protein
MFRRASGQVTITGKGVAAELEFGGACRITLVVEFEHACRDSSVEARLDVALVVYGQTLGSMVFEVKFLVPRDFLFLRLPNVSDNNHDGHRYDVVRVCALCKPVLNRIASCWA